jgi:Na+/H+ antiporter NhaD/arsenite permease-like protein
LSISLLLLLSLYHSSLSHFIDHDITHLLITSLSGEVGPTEYVCTHLFVVVILATDPDYVSEEFE